jgi:hypothetical protein
MQIEIQSSQATAQAQARVSRISRMSQLAWWFWHLMIILGIVKMISDFVEDLESYGDMPELIPMDEEDF